MLKPGGTAERVSSRSKGANIEEASASLDTETGACEAWRSWSCGGEGAANARYREQKAAHEASMAFTKPLTMAAVPGFLNVYGFEAEDASAWGPAREPLGSQLQLRVVEHLEVDGLTWYCIECALERPSIATLHWRAPRRLSHFQAFLHGPIKEVLGDAYVRLFDDACFAQRGGLPGTTRRLDAWCGRLAQHLNLRQLSPVVCGLTLHFLGPPLTWSPGCPGARRMAERDDGAVCFSTFLPPRQHSDDPSPDLFGVPTSSCYCHGEQAWRDYINRSTHMSLADNVIHEEIASRKVASPQQLSPPQTMSSGVAPAGEFATQGSSIDVSI